MTESLEQEIRALRSLYGSQRDPEGRAFAPRADAFRRAGEFRQAVDLLREGLDRHPGFVPGHLVAAQLYLEKGLLEEGELAARRAVALDDENTMAWGLLAGALEARGALAQARDARARLAALEGAGPQEAGLPPAAEPVTPEPAEAMAEPEPEPVVEIASLAPDVVESEVELEVEPVVEIASLAPDVTEPEPEPWVEVAALAPADLPSDELPESEPLVTRTMGELYARQGLSARALSVFRQLLEASPGDDELRRRVQELEGAGEEPAAEAEAEAVDAELAWAAAGDQVRHEVETPFAWTAPDEVEEAPPGPPAATYFRRMLAWEPGAAPSEGAGASPAGDA
ncbi:MAG: tetratricopeptide repeat protein [Gemmatimonadetes bacterium]|nr:tetratricopeptide repeat protein [Gemmatimonadota bacterium]